MIKFCFQPGESTREKTAIYVGARQLGYETTSSKTCLKDHIPVGDVPYCEAGIPYEKQYSLDAIIDFYPEFLKEYRYREIKLAYFDDLIPHLTCIRTRGFLKRADQWKPDFKSRIVEADESIENNFYYWSEPVAFLQEWRYYIAEGKLITTGWYDGVNEDEPAPELNIKWPTNYNGAVDFGRLVDGRMALVEAHAPFACGWYGENHVDYALWQAKAWESWIK